MKSTLNKGPELLSDPVSRLLAHVIPDGERLIIGLGGYPGSGKSMLCAQWVEKVQEHRGAESIVVLGLDGFHFYREQLSRMDDPKNAFARRGAPFTFDPEQFIEKLKELRSAAGKKAVDWPGFEHGIGDPVPDAISVPSDCPLVLVEGIYILYRNGPWASLEGMFDETWFLDISIETAMNRLCLRHQKASGLSEKQARQRADSNDRLNCDFISPGRETADWLVE